MAALNDAQLIDIKGIIARFDDRIDGYFKERHAILVCEETLIADAGHGKLADADLAAGISAFKAAWTLSKTERNDRFELAWLAWEYLNLANIRNDQSAIDKIEAAR